MLCTITIPDDYPIDILIISSLSSFKKILIRQSISICYDGQILMTAKIKINI